MTLGQLAALLGGELHGPAELVIQRPGAYDEGRPDEIVVAFDAAAAELAEQTAAGAVVLPAGVRSAKPYVTVGDPKQALAAIVTAFSPGPPPAAGVHPTAIVDPSVALPGDLTIGPYAVVGAQVVIGEGCRLAAIVGDRQIVPARRRSRPSPRVTLYPEVELGDRVVVHSGAVLGADGYGYLQMGGRHVKIPQLGRVVIEADVEIGANTCIDRAMVGSTRVGSGTKIDNLVQVAHNVQVGEHCLLASQTGIAGSCRLGKYVMMGGQVGLRDHVTIGDGARIGAKSGVMRKRARRRVGGRRAGPAAGRVVPAVGLRATVPGVQQAAARVGAAGGSNGWRGTRS